MYLIVTSISLYKTIVNHSITIVYWAIFSWARMHETEVKRCRAGQYYSDTVAYLGFQKDGENIFAGQNAVLTQGEANQWFAPPCVSTAFETKFSNLFLW